MPAGRRKATRCAPGLQSRLRGARLTRGACSRDAASGQTFLTCRMPRSARAKRRSAALRGRRNRPLLVRAARQAALAAGAGRGGASGPPSARAGVREAAAGQGSGGQGRAGGAAAAGGRAARRARGGRAGRRRSRAHAARARAQAGCWSPGALGCILSSTCTAHHPGSFDSSTDGLSRKDDGALRQACAECVAMS